MNRVFRLWNSPMALSWASLALRLIGNSFLIILISVKFSVDETAVWLMLVTINNVFLMADLGLSPLFARFFGYALGGAAIEDLADRISSQTSKPDERAVAEPNWDSVRALFAQQRIFFAGVAIFIIFVGGAIGTWSMLPRLHALASPFSGWGAWFVVLASSAFLLAGRSYGNFLTGIDRIPLQKKWETLFSAIAIVLALLSMFFWHNLLVLSIAYFGVPMLTVLVHRYFAFHLHDGKLRSVGHIRRWDVSTWRVLWPQAWRVAIGIFSTQIVLNFSSLLLVRSIDGARAAQLLFSLRFVRILDNFSTVPFYVYIPRMSRLRFEGRFREFWAIAERGMMISLLVLGIPGIAIAVLGPLVLHAAGSKVSLVSAPVWLLLVLGTLVMRYGALHLQLVTVANKVVWHIVASVSGAIFLGVLFLTISRMPPDFAYSVAQLAAAAFFFAPYSLRHSYPVLDQRARRRDLLIAGFNIGAVVIAIGFAFAWGPA